MSYDYQTQVAEDIRDFINEDFVPFLENGAVLFRANYGTDLVIDQEEMLYRCFNADSVTGNASGSYYCNAFKAREALSGMWNLDDAVNDSLTAYLSGLSFGEVFDKGEEYIDCIIRCACVDIEFPKVVKAIREELEEKAVD